jgi:hypothetical protein
MSRYKGVGITWLEKIYDWEPRWVKVLLLYIGFLRLRHI